MSGLCFAPLLFWFYLRAPCVLNEEENARGAACWMGLELGVAQGHSGTAPSLTLLQVGLHAAPLGDICDNPAFLQELRFIFSPWRCSGLRFEPRGGLGTLDVCVLTISESVGDVEEPNP